MTTETDNLHNAADGENKNNFNAEDQNSDTNQTNSDIQNNENQHNADSATEHNLSEELIDSDSTEKEIEDSSDEISNENTEQSDKKEEILDSEKSVLGEEIEETSGEVNNENTEQSDEKEESEEILDSEKPVLEEESNEESDSVTDHGESENMQENQKKHEKINQAEDYKHEDSEAEERVADETQIPLKNYDALSLAALIEEAKTLLKNNPAQLLREHFNQIREAVRVLLEEEEKQTEPVEDETENDAKVEKAKLASQLNNQLRREFNSIYSDYKHQLDLYYKEQEKQQQENLKIRLQIIDDLKSLYQDPAEETSNIFTQFRKIKTLWHNTGSIPRAQAGNVFRTYFHHLDNFYKYLDMNKELRELDYAHNLEVRASIIKRAEELVEEENVQKALNELQYLHRLWKEEAVPVAEEMREPTWQRFKALTQKIHDRKFELSEKIKEEQNQNLQKKNEILDRIRELFSNSEKKSHIDWQKGITKINSLRDEFIAAGRVSKEYNQKLWDEFKSLTREFNHKKNEFYKTLKNEQQQNLDRKVELLALAKEHAKSTDWEKSVEVIKKIQFEWKKIGHVPRKDSDKIWKEFKNACNLFFDNYKQRAGNINAEFAENLTKKEALLEEVKSFIPTDDRQTNLNKINEFNIKWGEIGKVPAARMGINSDFSKAINHLVKSTGLSNDEMRQLKITVLMDKIKSGQNEQMLDDEIRVTRKLMEELEKEINQLENNIGFFSDEKSPLLINFHKQIEEKKSRLAEATMKLKKLHKIDFKEEEPTDSQENLTKNNTEE